MCAWDFWVFGVLVYMRPTYNQRKEFLKLIRKYLKGNATEEQLDFINKYYESFETDENVLDALSEDKKKIIEDEIGNSILQKIRTDKVVPVRPLWRRLSVAAAVLLAALSVGLYFNFPSSDYLATKENEAVADTSIIPDIAPGGNKAILKLADGSTISLNDVKHGESIKQGSIEITKTEEGLLTYTVVADEHERNFPVQFNTILTPKGGQYQVKLPDGTNVWLNAASSLKYPTRFNGMERKVELTGEAYFEVNSQWSSGKKVPFLVSTSSQTIEVLGTHFNVNAYSDEPSTRTTLLEGSVRVVRDRDGDGSIVLKPGEQAILTANKRMAVSRVNTGNVVAWKSGLFQFQNSDIESVMREISRWYDVEVEFEGKVPDIKLWGKVYRNVNASEALKILAYFDLKYRILQTGKIRKIIIS